VLKQKNEEHFRGGHSYGEGRAPHDTLPICTVAAGDHLPWTRGLDDEMDNGMRGNSRDEDNAVATQNDDGEGFAGRGCQPGLRDDGRRGQAGRGATQQISCRAIGQS
jgi:hypothetical protein